MWSAFNSSVSRLARLIDAARARGVLVIFVQAIYDPEYLSDPMRERNRRRTVEMPRCLTGSWGADFYEVSPAPDEPIVIKHRYSAMLNTTLPTILKERGIKSLLLTGVSTDTCVEFTGRDAYFLDHYVTIVADCCGAYSESDHANALARFDRDYGAVVNSQELIDVWSNGRSVRIRLMRMSMPDLAAARAPARVAASLRRPPRMLISKFGSSVRFTRRAKVPCARLIASHLTASRGEFVSILGPSGCGKSTLLMIAAGLLSASDGSVIVDGRPVTKPRTDLGIVFQSPVLLEWRTALGNIMLQAEARKLDRREAEERARELLASVGLAGFADKYPHELSGGMRQRVSICRALIHNPPQLLMDEPFGALDALTRDQLVIDVQRIWNERRITALFITHSVAEAVFLSDRVIVMTPRPGRIDQDHRHRFAAAAHARHAREQAIHRLLAADHGSAVGARRAS